MFRLCMNDMCGVWVFKVGSGSGLFTYYLTLVEHGYYAVRLDLKLVVVAG